VSLHPTKTRLRVLRAVAEDRVTESTWFPYPSYMQDPDPDGRSRTVTDICRSMRIAGWVELAPRGHSRSRSWMLTDAGRAVLEANGGAS
jgi:hypothetical protein